MGRENTRQVPSTVLGTKSILSRHIPSSSFPLKAILTSLEREHVALPSQDSNSGTRDPAAQPFRNYRVHLPFPLAVQEDLEDPSPAFLYPSHQDFLQPLRRENDIPMK